LVGIRFMGKEIKRSLAVYRRLTTEVIGQGQLPPIRLEWQVIEHCRTESRMLHRHSLDGVVMPIAKL